MRHVPDLKTAEQRLRWKVACRRLIRASGKRQHEVAVEMARLVSIQTGRQVQDSAFVSALSRFCNAKDSAFPGWFTKPESRLFPLASALGLDNDEPIWSALSEAVDDEPIPQKNWHPSFPDVVIDIPVRLNGKPISELLISFQHRMRMRRGASPGVCWVYGPVGAGKGVASRQLREALAIHPKLKDAYVVRTATRHPDGLGPMDFALSIDTWSDQDISLLINRLFEKEVISPAQRQIGLAFSKQVGVNAAWLGFDRRPIAIIETVAEILTNGLPKELSIQRRRRLERIWKRAVRKVPTLSALRQSDWSRLWAKRYQDNGSSSWYMFNLDEMCQALRDTVYSERGSGIDRQAALALLSAAKQGRKPERDEAIDSLIDWVSKPPVERLVDDLIQAGLLVSTEQGLSSPDVDLAWLWAVDGMVQLNQLGFDVNWARLSDPILPRLTRELAIMGFDFKDLVSILAKAPEWCRLDGARMALRFAAETSAPAPTDWLIEKWADVLWGESHSLFRPVGGHHDVHNVLHTIGLRYVKTLPVLTMIDAVKVLRQYVSKATLSLSDGMRQPPVRDLQALSPVQFPPRNMAEWNRWKRMGSMALPAWRVLELHAEQGSVSAARLLSEGNGGPAPQWTQAPVGLRLKWLGRFGCRSATLRAFQVIATEVWRADSDYDWRPESWTELVEAGKRLGINRLGPYFERWASPLTLSARSQALMRLSSLLCDEFGDLDRLQICYERMLEWLLDDTRYFDGMIRFQGRSVMASGFELNDLSLKAFEYCLDAAKRLHGAGRPDALRELWDNRHPDQWRQQAFTALTLAEDPHVVDRWIEMSPMDLPHMREALNQSPRLLQMAWRRDRRARRRESILQIAGLQNPTPPWAIAYAKKRIQADQQWPQWLSAHDEAAVPLALNMLKYADEPHKMWWAYVVHRFRPWPQELLASLEHWLIHDPLPFERRSKSQRAQLGPNSTPGLALETLIHLCRQRISEGAPESFFERGFRRLWSALNFESTQLSWLIADVLEELCGPQALLSTEWKTSTGRLRRRLIDLWIQQATPQELLDAFDSDLDIGVFARAYGISVGIPKAFGSAKKRFIERGDPVAFERLSSAQSTMTLPLLQELLATHPNMKLFAMKLGDSALSRRDDGALRAWLRQMAYSEGGS